MSIFAALLAGLFAGGMARWAWPGCAESARCRKRGCRTCAWLVPCDEALLRLYTKLPRAGTLRRPIRDIIAIVADRGRVLSLNAGAPGRTPHGDSIAVVSAPPGAALLDREC